MVGVLSHIQISGLIALLVALPFLIMSVRNLLLSKASKDWPKVNGIIKEIKDFGAEVKFKLVYEYVVEKNSYKSSRIIFSTSSTYHRYNAREFEKKYAIDQVVNVYYNPLKPKQAVLEPGRNDGSLAGVIMFGILMLLGGLAIFNQSLFYQLIDRLM